MILSFLNRQIILLLAVLYCSGCSQDFLSKEKETKSDESADDDTEDLASDTPAEVSGSFITILCDSNSYFVDEVSASLGRVIVSCLIKNPDGSQYKQPITAISSEVFIDGTKVTSAAIVSSSPPWNFHVETSEEDRKKLSFGRFEIYSGDKKEVGETKVFDYKWNKDPLFALLVIALTATPDVERVKMTFETVAIWVGGQDSQFVFVSDHLFSGNVGVGNADAYCDSEGKKLIPDRTWRAVLASATETVRERIPIRALAFNLFASMIFDHTATTPFEERFWAAKHLTGYRHTQTGKEVHLYDEFDERLQVIDYGWSGFHFTGARDTESGDCNNWTSNDPKLFGGIADLRSDNIQWASYRKISCAVRARIACMSL